MSEGRSRGFVPMLGAAAVVAALVRMPFLADSLWYDEIAAFLGYSLGGPGAAVGTYFTQANHVLHSLLAWCSTTLFGVDEVTVRLPSFLAGIGAVAAVGFLGREAGGVRLGAVAAALAAVMPTAVLPATEARGYSLMMLFAALASALFVRGWRRGGAGTWALYAACCALGVWSHLVTVCVPAFHAAWCVGKLVTAGGSASDEVRGIRRRALGGLVAVACAAGLTALLYAPIIPAIIALQREFRAIDGNEPTLLGPEGRMMLVSLGGSWNAWGSLAALPLVVAGIAAARRDVRVREALVISLGGALVALVFPVFLNSWLYARFLAFTVPGVAVLLAAGLLWIHARRRSAAWILAACAVGAWMAVLATVGPRQQLREAVKWVVDHRAEGEQAFAVGLPDDVHRWYSTGYGIEMPGSGPYGSDVDEQLAKRGNAWAVLLYPRTMPEATERLHAAGFMEDVRFAGWIDSGAGEIVVFRRR
jgi:mannosyltransferase